MVDNKISHWKLQIWVILLLVVLLTDAGIPSLGPNVALNNEFTNWTGDDPDNWDQNTDNDIDQNPAGWCRLIDLF